MVLQIPRAALTCSLRAASILPKLSICCLEDSATGLRVGGSAAFKQGVALRDSLRVVSGFLASLCQGLNASIGFHTVPSYLT